MRTKEEKLKKLKGIEDKFFDDLEKIDDPQILREKLTVLHLVARMVRFYEDGEKR